MALIKCSECGKEISDKANACPGCGCPVIVREENYKSENAYSNELVSEATNNNVENIESSASDKPRKKITKKKGILLSVIIAVIVISAVILCSVSKKTPKDRIVGTWVLEVNIKDFIVDELQSEFANSGILINRNDIQTDVFLRFCIQFTKEDKFYYWWDTSDIEKNWNSFAYEMSHKLGDLLYEQMLRKYTPQQIDYAAMEKGYSNGREFCAAQMVPGIDELCEGFLYIEGAGGAKYKIAKNKIYFDSDKKGIKYTLDENILSLPELSEITEVREIFGEMNFKKNSKVKIDKELKKELDDEIRVSNDNKASADKSLCDMVRSAVSTAMLDPDVNDDDNYVVPKNGTYTLEDITNMPVLGKEVRDIMGTDAKQTEDMLKSKKAKGSTIMVILDGDYDIPNKITVYIKDDKSIKAGPATP